MVVERLHWPVVGVRDFRMRFSYEIFVFGRSRPLVGYQLSVRNLHRIGKHDPRDDGVLAHGRRVATCGKRPNYETELFIG